MTKKLTGKQIDRLRARMLAEPCLAPLHGDSEKTRAVVEGIHQFIRSLGSECSIEFYKDKIPEWRRALRAARYDDWDAARKSDRAA